MNKKYEYKGNVYCEDDLSDEIYNYGGDLYDLFLTLESDGKAGCEKIYYIKGSYLPYEDYEDLIETEFSDLEVEEDE